MNKVKTKDFSYIHQVIEVTRETVTPKSGEIGKYRKITAKIILPEAEAEAVTRKGKVLKW